jgi:nucleotide-binding universal stress UspA family protein
MIVIRNILVPTDFSEPAESALRYAEALAQEFNSRLHLFHVVPELYAYPWGTEMSAVPLADLIAQSEQASKERLSEVVRGLTLGAGADFATAVGPPVERILEYVRDHQVDLIVMGRHGRGMVGHLLLGSVVERVMRRATVPVLTVHGGIHNPQSTILKAQDHFSGDFRTKSKRT